MWQVETPLASKEHIPWKQPANELTAETQEADENNHVNKTNSELE